MKKKVISIFLILCMAASVASCGKTENSTGTENTVNESTQSDTDASENGTTANGTESSDTSEREAIEEALNLANNEEQEWTYSASADAWTLSVVSAVCNPEIPEEQGVSVAVPGAYVKGIDTDGDGNVDVTASDGETAVCGSLVIDYEAQITDENGQTYTAATCPVILTTGAAGYSEQQNSLASTAYAQYGYVSVSCGNRGKQSSVTDEDGNTVYTGDAPLCLVDQKAAARFVKYNILLGNLPGSVDYFVSTGGSGGGAHAVMFAATSDNSDYYDYQIEAGAVGVYQNEDGSYSTTVTINGTDYEISDGAWGCVAYSAITSLYESDMAQAFEYYLNPDFNYNTSFQAQLAEYLSAEYMEYINDQNLSVEESAVGFDLNGDGDYDDTIALTIEYDLENYPETNGYYGTYLDLYLAEFTENLQWYLDNLDYADGWTWFAEDGTAMTDEEVAAMTSEERAQAFLEGRYAKSSSADGGMGGFPGGDGQMPSGAPGDGQTPDGAPGDGQMADGAPGDGQTPDGTLEDGQQSDTVSEMFGEDIRNGGPDADSSAAAGSSVDSSNYATYEEMVEAYAADIAEIEAGDKYGNNIVSLYNPLEYIGADDTDDPVWTRVVMGAAEDDQSMFASLNLEIAWLSAGVDCEIEWQWDGGHVPSEIFGESLALTVDEKYGTYVSGVETTKEAATVQTVNGTAEQATGTDISGWVDASDLSEVSVSLADAIAYRSAGASKSVAGFDTIDYGQEDYEFGDSDSDARHWDKFLLNIFENEEYAGVLSGLFNQD